MSTLYSGGCEGADLYWANLALQHDHKVIHIVSNSNKSKDEENVSYIRLTKEDCDLVHDKCVTIGEYLDRDFPSSEDHINELVYRNYYQIASIDTLYSVGFFSDNDQIKGKKAWAIEMFIDRIENKYKENENMPVYFFDQDDSVWYRAFIADAYAGLGKLYEWEECNVDESDAVPKPNGKYAAIGTRDLRENGKQAMRELFASV